ncbi:hypothetical protein [Amycolatopsis sp. CA-230715]|uniref:hypothetical protein n=1 Tax=Amycolatopsis sp. CA-230715 TaxID=2745196 RepID=UPI001C01124D|nr:hypothetical protein [Amycolatopsis sp. CA-230715]
MAIEIDRFGKVWSLQKLLAEVDAGCVALWVRWRGHTRIEIPETDGLVDIHDTATYRPPPPPSDHRPVASSPGSATHHQDLPVPPSPDEIDRARTPAGGFTRDQLAAWGVACPPPKGWKNQLIDRWHQAQQD